MHIATQEFPRIWISNSSPSNWKEELEALLDQGQRFVLLTRELPGAEEGSDKEEFSQWIKDNRSRLSTSCAASLVVVSNALMAFSLNAFVAPLSEKFGFPVRVVHEDDLDEQVTAFLEASPEVENS
ncbi:hypothetical protein E5C31_11535 [Providencia rettgeri]|uniref:Uncharacterized protein n=1 Tax=Alcaligenes parafaecalis TaxID=171260 RepID=A0ABT3VI27_9BURK|nr:hypothetical protein [Alcaligenes parafaecalis]MBY6346593.1 hypothetical protein [Providencia rettgeri]MCX5462875.1 hypothetical protein [Alcaligenes parafaecalis]